MNTGVLMKALLKPQKTLFYLCSSVVKKDFQNTL